MSDTTKFRNVIILGIGHMLMFSAYNPMVNVQQTILKSAKNESFPAGYVSGFHADGYTSQALLYGVLTLANWLVPPIVSSLGPRLTLIISGTTYAIFIAQFIVPNDVLMYGASALLGLGGAALHGAQGVFITQNSDDQSLTRNTALFSFLFHWSSILGNLVIVHFFRNKELIDHETRTAVAFTLFVFCCSGIGVFFFLKPIPSSERIILSSYR